MLVRSKLHITDFTGVIWAMVLMISLILTGCTSTPTPTEEPPETSEIKIGILISMTEETPFFISLIDGAKEAAEEGGATLIIEYANDDVEIQKNQIQAMINQGVTAILVNPINDDVIPVMESADEAGLLVFTIDRSVSSDVVLSHIASDNVDGGKIAGEYLAETLNREGKIVELQGTPGSSAASDRGAGFNEMIANFPDIEIIAQESANFNRDDGKTVFAQILTEYPEIDGVFAHNDDMILGAIEAAKEAGRADEMIFVGFDAIDEAITALESGDLSATVAQRPAEMGRIGVETIVKYLNEDTIPDFIPIALALITK